MVSHAQAYTLVGMSVLPLKGCRFDIFTLTMRREENFCRFCSKRLPALWKPDPTQELAKEELRVAPVMAVRSVRQRVMAASASRRRVILVSSLVFLSHFQFINRF